MIADTLEIYRRYTGAAFDRIKLYDNMAEMWEARSAEYADLTAIADNGSTYTYRQLAEDVARFRTVLRRHVSAPARVALLAANSYDWVKAFLAIVTLGCTAVALPAHLDAKTVAGTQKLFGFAAIVTDNPEKAARCQDVSVISAAETADTPTGAAACKGSDGCTIIMTGGTTGMPKGALLSHTAVLQGVVNSCLGYTNVFEQRYMLVLPLTHVFGLIRNLLASLYTGSTLLICRDNKNMFRDAAAFQPTIMVLVPALAEMALTLSKKFGRNMFGNSLHTLICGAANVPQYLVEEYHRMGVALYPGYGLTESANLVSGNPEALRKPESVGLIYGGMDYKVVDGELWLKGVNMMDGYATAEDNATAYEDGYFKTGDLVRIDDEGFLYITGRIKEIIVLSNGENVSPAELEVKFYSLDVVQDCLVYDINENGKEQLVLEVLPRMSSVKAMGIEDIYSYLKDEVGKINETLPTFERINKIIIRDTDFIRTPAMKIARNLNGNVKK